MINELINQLQKGDKKALARAISLVENESEDHGNLLSELKLNNQIQVIGLTGPPGSGKSTLVNGLIKKLSADNKKIGVLAIDPTSPFNLGSLLGDRIRMRDHFVSEDVFIRSLASRGSLGGVSAKTIEIVDVMRAAGFDYIFVETVGVGQSEIEIVGIADTTILVLVPESGDEIQTIKSGIMEIADIFVVNKADREGAQTFANNLHLFLKDKYLDDWKPPVVQAVATKEEGLDKIIDGMNGHFKVSVNTREKQRFLYTEKAYRLIQNARMNDINKTDLHNEIAGSIEQENFNLHAFVHNYLSRKD
ncbi:methylmalonyl Co-A mutase-associated GTPase MeaB [Candidatus Amoebophilus asiaticus]|nr:methylmalonyl Co-A mutase-associated GTPase MeaB [Candidatus Amoebophilus asiaticus]